MRDLYSPDGNELIEVFNTTLFSDCWFCPKEDKVYVQKLTEVPKQHFKENYYTNRFEQIKRFALIQKARQKVTKEDLIKLGYYEQN